MVLEVESHAGEVDDGLNSGAAELLRVTCITAKFGRPVMPV